MIFKKYIYIYFFYLSHLLKKRFKNTLKAALSTTTRSHSRRTEFCISRCPENMINCAALSGMCRFILQYRTGAQKSLQLVTYVNILDHNQMILGYL